MKPTDSQNDEYASKVTGSPPGPVSYLLVSCLVVLSILVRFVNIHSPLLEMFGFRQTQTAFTVWTFVEEGITFCGYQTPLFGPPWQIPFEFPIFQATAALLYKAGIWNLDIACRLTGILYFYISAVFLFLLCELHLPSRWASIGALLFYLWSPYMIFWSRTSMIDYAAVAFALGYCYFLLIWLRNYRLMRLFWFAITFGCLAYLTKITTVLTVTIPIGWFILMHVSESLRANTPHAGLLERLLGFARERKLFLVALTCAIVLPVAAAYAWVLHRNRIAGASPWTAQHVSYHLTKWVYGTWSQRLSLENWMQILSRIKDYILPGISCLFAAAGLLFARKYTARSRGFVYIMFLGAVVTVFAYFNLYCIHDYYLIAITPALSIAAGMGIYHLLVVSFRKMPLLIVAAIVLILLPFHTKKIRDYMFIPYKMDYNNSLYRIGLAVRNATKEDERVVVADFTWDSTILYYARRKGFMLWNMESEKLNKFLKLHHFSTVVCKNEHPILFSNWRYRREIAEIYDYKIFRVGDSLTELAR